METGELTNTNVYFNTQAIFKITRAKNETKKNAIYKKRIETNCLLTYQGWWYTEIVGKECEIQKQKDYPNQHINFIILKLKLAINNEIFH